MFARVERDTSVVQTLLSPGSRLRVMGAAASPGAARRPLRRRDMGRRAARRAPAAKPIRPAGPMEHRTGSNRLDGALSRLDLTARRATGTIKPAGRT